MHRFALLSLLSLTAMLSRAGALPLVVEGEARAIIVVEDPRNTFHVTAANDLQLQLKRASGAVVPIVHAVDPASAASSPVRLIVGAGSLS
jgi:hypothetical protein